MPAARFQLRLSPACVWVIALIALAGCGDGDGSFATTTSTTVYGLANRCYTVAAGASYLARTAAGDAYAFGASESAATPFFFKPSRLATYLLFDDQRGYLVSDGIGLQRALTLESDITKVDDTFQSEAEWVLEASARGEGFHLRQRKTGLYLSATGVGPATSAVTIEVHSAESCAEFPEESTNTEGRVMKSRFDDGTLYGFCDAHSHILANFGFGGGGIFHGAPFHPLGVEHALGSCERFHGPEGRADLFGAGYDAGQNINLQTFIQALVTHQLPNFNHATEGYPEFKSWPNAHTSSTHQVQYYKWIERAYLGGLRLVVQHAVSNQVICDLLGNGGFQPIRYACDDMTAVDRELEEVYNMQDYIDAQEGGPGKGWFRVVTSPAQAREVILAGKMAVVLGIETSNLFNCLQPPREGFPQCTEDYVRERLDHYYQKGVRAIFPVHKYDNAFSAGDGHKGFIELGNLVQTGQFSNFNEDCDPNVPTVFDGGKMSFPGLNMPRDDYFAPAPNDFSKFYLDPIGELAPLLDRLTKRPLPGPHTNCQAAGMTPLGEYLIEQMMQKGMIIELDHLPRKSYRRAFELIEQNHYPAAGTHGLDNFGRLYALGGISVSGFSTCRSANGRADDGYQTKLRKIIANGGYPGLGFGLDLNGFAGAPGPRFGAGSGCGETQTDPLTYPFTSYAGDVTFNAPKVGTRAVDFNTEGLVHIGLLPDWIEDVRRDGVSDTDIEPLFHSAEGYVRMWETAESRSAALRQ